MNLHKKIRQLKNEIVQMVQSPNVELNSFYFKTPLKLFKQQVRTRAWIYERKVNPLLDLMLLALESPRRILKIFPVLFPFYDLLIAAISAWNKSGRIQMWIGPFFKFEIIELNYSNYFL